MAGTLPGAAIIAALKECNVEMVISVPDIATSDGLLCPLAKHQGPDQKLRLVRICRKEEGSGISAGLSFCSYEAVWLSPVSMPKRVRIDAATFSISSVIATVIQRYPSISHKNLS